MRALAILALLAAPSGAQEVLPWSDPGAAAIWPEHVGLGDKLDILVFKNDWVELQIVDGFAICGNQGRCPGRMIEGGQVVGEIRVCSDSDSYELRDRFFTACGVEYSLAPGD